MMSAIPPPPSIPPGAPRPPAPPCAAPASAQGEAGLAGLCVGLVGCGHMGGALARGWVRAGLVAPGRLLLTARASAPALAAELGARAVGLGALLEGADVVVLAVKPQQLEGLRFPPLARAGGPLWVSALAGTTLAALARALPSPPGAPPRVARAMPNLPAQVGLGATLLCAPPEGAPGALSAGERAVVSALFGAVGLAEWLPSEELMHAGTALAGCGPAYCFIAAEALADAGVLLGLPRALAQRLAAQTLYGSGALALTAHPAALKDGVTSPGGVTIAGVRALEQRAFRAALIEAVAAAAERSVALAGARPDPSPPPPSPAPPRS